MARTWLRGTYLRTAFRGAPGLKTHTPQGEKIQRRDKREPVSPDRWDALVTEEGSQSENAWKSRRRHRETYTAKS